MSLLRLVFLVALAFGLWNGWRFVRGDAPDAPVLAAGDPRLATGERGIVLLAAEWCGYCRQQRNAFETANVRYRILDVDQPDGDRAMQALGARGVPVTIVGQQVVHGYQPAAVQALLTPLGYRDVF